ncbi:beta-ketoacyl synthase N-terminal-like domain-containing protein [Flavobacterium sp. FlaQc-52]|uniref:type I polyketide synthase n=1 Tax=Flavobacterium sp. FlaQc-52 TaxID=3374185 RepID=UPI0037576E78
MESKLNSVRKKDIAIIGMSGKFHKSENIEAFWNNLVKGQELIHFYDDEELEKLGIGKELLKKPNYIKSSAFIDNSESFDYSFFGYTKEEAELMDPQIRIMHEHVWLALEDASYNLDQYKEKIGLYLSASDNLNWRAETLLNPNNAVGSFMTARLADKNFISTLISYSLNFKGPSFYINTACSSALTALHIACRSLLLKECSTALAGAVSINTTTEYGYLYEDDLIFSNDGHCRTFDKDSSGTTFGEGVGVVVLKRLEDALNDKDHIYAVIRATAVNNDGKRKVGYTAPSVNGQADCIKLAHSFAGITPEDVSYIEAHGTATKLGDPVEIEALNKAFNYNKNHSCAIGSVKSNLGHLDAVAGIVGVIKTALSLKNKMLPPSINYKEANPEINFESGPFYVNDKLQKWVSNQDQLLNAGVSSFGIGGTNAHVVLEEAPEFKENFDSNLYQLITFSAKTKTALKNYEKTLRNFLEKNEEVKIPALAYTLNTGRKDFRYRNYIVCKNKEEAINQLIQLDTVPEKEISNNRKKKIVFMFSGQGSQYFLMAKEVYLNNPFFQSIIDEGFKIITKLTGIDYSIILGYTNSETVNKELINNTFYTQPLLFLVEYAFAKLYIRLGVTPDSMIGHSLGEYVAACISEVFSFEDALYVVTKRAELMAKIEEGDMIGIGVNLAEIKPLLPKNVSIAAINTANSFVASGTKKAISEFTEILGENNISYVPLKTSHAFHSEMMDSILEEYEEIIKKVTLSSPKFPFVSNLTGEEITKEDATSAKYWVAHLRGTVNFFDGINYLLQKGDGLYIEIGPGHTLTSFLKQNQYYNSDQTAVHSIRHIKNDVNDYQFFNESLGRIWEHGIEVDWEAYYDYQKHYKIPAPTYVFDKTTLPVKVSPITQLMNNGGAFKNAERSIFNSYYVNNWKKSLIESSEKKSEEKGVYLIFSNSGKTIKAIENQMLSLGNELVMVTKGSSFVKSDSGIYSIDPNNSTNFQELFADLKAKKIKVLNVIYNWLIDAPKEEDVNYNPIKFLYESVNQFSIKVTFLSKFNTRVLGNEVSSISMDFAIKMADLFDRKERLFTNYILDADQDQDDPVLIENIVNDLIFNEKDSTVAYRNNNRWVPFFENIKLNSTKKSTEFEGEKNYLVIHSTAGIVKPIVDHLSSLSNNSNVLLLCGNTTANEDSIAENVIKYQTNLECPKQFKETIEFILKEHGSISGIICNPELWNEQVELEPLDVADLATEVKIKTSFIDNLYEAIKNINIDFVWFPLRLSSIIEGSKYRPGVLSEIYTTLFKEHKSDELSHWITVYLDDLTGRKLTDEEIITVFKNSFLTKNISSLMVSHRDLNHIIAESKKTEDPVLTTKNTIERPIVVTAYTAPETKLEAELCEMIQDFFNYEKVGITDDFFELGGDSLKAMIFIKRIEKQYSILLDLQDFYQKATVKMIAMEIDLATKILNVQTAKTNMIKI